MYTEEKRMKAVELYIQYHFSAAAVIRELGYPDRKTLPAWYKDYQEELKSGIKRTHCRISKYTEDKKQYAVEYYLSHGKNYMRTVRNIGYPTRDTLSNWVKELVPDDRKIRHKSVEYTQKQKIEAVNALCHRQKSAQEVAEGIGVSRVLLYRWKHKLLSAKEDLAMAITPEDQPPEEKDDLLAEIEQLKKDIRKLEMERDLLEGAAELIKKDGGVSLRELSNKEKTILIDALRGHHPLEELMKMLKIAGSSYYYHHGALKVENKYESLKQDIIRIFELNHRCYGYRRIGKALNSQGIQVSEKVIRRLMSEAGLSISTKRRNKYNSYKGEIAPAPENLIARDFHAEKPNEKWLTDITEFSIPAGKVYLSPIIDCFDGLVVNWTISTHPTSDMVNTMLDNAARILQHDEHPIVHSDRGGHYRWPGWIERMERYGLTRSMSKKACTADNAACEGFFGRIKNEMFYNRYWQNVSIEIFIDYLDDYLHWYNQERIKMSLGGLSPIRYRKQLGLAA